MLEAGETRDGRGKRIRKNGRETAVSTQPVNVEKCDWEFPFQSAGQERVVLQGWWLNNECG